MLIGICDDKPLNYIKDIINKDIPFTNYDIENRINPKKTFKETKSIIVVGVPYGKKYLFEMDDKKRGNISQSGIGIDYHIVVRNKIQSLISYIKKYIECEIDYKIFVDTGSMVERELAKKSGIGFQGKNCSIISEKYGSYISLGYCLINYKFETTKGYDFHYNQCGDCNLCTKACPTNALKNDFECNHYECVSYLTQRKEEIPDDLKFKMGNSIYGCDICQIVCPYNKDKFIENIYNINIPMPTLEYLKSLSNSQFKKHYGNSGIFWRGKKTIIRNVNIAENNLPT